MEGARGAEGRGRREGDLGSGGATFSPRSIPYSATALSLITSEYQRALSLGVLLRLG
jgi:hypothetical protein